MRNNPKKRNENTHLLERCKRLEAALIAMLDTSLKVDDLEWADAIERAGTSAPCDQAAEALRKG